ncbi:MULTISPECIES: outer membrane protein assembly factor BamE [Neisseria]|uniref:SmpA / OmlA family protein n=1 Tax=Neisseria musculi TaxID=1815583 RepID=A0A7H1MDY8_9NEIS|nr:MULTISPECIES: outer membrane protein assembly factor BamE [Neisseria]MBF0804588.1 outer membrane protein assembly factor BamE [Neisseria sp. 19428wB4_WF04]QNT59853.1 smpA / OmlA family protein [Neisseria musculi]TFU40408.1 outer membrane protein assembly factor BamE [Neisseria sp. WF04]
MKTKTIIQAGASLLLAAALSACATKSNVSRDGTTDNPVFPPVHKVSPSFKHNKGTFPTADELAQIKAGMTKDQFYKLLGRPHFNEGMFNVREWDYVFHFHTPGQGTDNVTTCQFKIIYDSKKYARSFHWKAVDPETASCPVAAPEPEPQIIVREVETSAKRIRQ